MRPSATPARITPSAVPKPAVASEPVLQWVSTPLPASIKAAPKAAHCTIGGQIFGFDRACFALEDLAPVGPGFAQRAAHARQRPGQVDRGGPRGIEALHRRRELVRSFRTIGASTPRAASTTPQAAAIPIAGAPRTVRAWIAAATSSLLPQRRYSTTNGSLRWSSSSRASPVQRIGRMRS